LALLLVPKPDEKRPHSIVIATENVLERVFEDVNANRLDVEWNDMMEIGKKLRVLGRSLCELPRFPSFDSGEWWNSDPEE